MRMRWMGRIVVLAGWLIAGVAGAQEATAGAPAAVDQTITLKVGWNAFWLGVAPENVTADELFQDWPTDSVSVYRATELGQGDSLSLSTNGITTPEQPFAIWLRGFPNESTLFRPLGDAVYLLKATEARTITLRGRPVGRRMDWHSATYGANYFGVSVPADMSVSPFDYLKGFEPAPTTIYRLGGTDDAPEATALMSSQKVKLGDVLVFTTDNPSDWNGAFEASPRYGVDFGEAGTVGTVTLTNRSGASQDLRIEHRGANAKLAPRLTIRYRDADNLGQSDEWQPLADVLTKTLEPGATWTLQLGLDRRTLGTTGEEVVDTLVCTDTGSARHTEILPLSAADYSTRAGRWPDGIWNLQAQLNTVTRVVGQELQEGLKTHRAMPVRLIVRVDGEGNMTLLQRFVAASLPDGELGSKVVVYGPEATPDVAATVTARLSTPVMAADQPEVPLTGAFHQQASATWTLAPNSTSNPFRHPYHPDHDGRSADYTASAPDGDTFANYTQPVKPELWSVTNTLTLQWADDHADLWLPLEQLSGTLIWQMTGLRAEGPITATGPFTMTRIIAAPDYRKE